MMFLESYFESLKSCKAFNVFFFRKVVRYDYELNLKT